MAKTAYELSVNLPNMAKGAEVEIPGLGVFKNGSTQQLEPEQVESFRNFHSQLSDEEDGSVVSNVGPTPLKANWPEGVTVATVSGSEVQDKGGDS